ncbi:LLM class flavin-dependent oxidoreductase [Micromonospora sp. NPDC048830]|uniref:LLM class flavin-dependent oxidoreductase n=1 Tax=Micromonospora sp. NPDC048830 TaxID=3364257 RepID=UPI00371E33F1
MTFSLQSTPTDAASWLDLARRAEAASFDALLAADHPGSCGNPFVALAAAASVTSTIGLGSNVSNLGVREPMLLATDVATLDLISGGRARLGVGAGHTPAEWRAVGRERPDVAGRVRRCIAATEAVRALLDGEEVTVDFPDLTMHAANLKSPRPVQRRIPLTVGTSNSTLLRWAGAHADIVGLAGFGRTLADGHMHEARWRADQIEAQLACVAAGAAGRAEPPPLEALVQRVVVTDDAETAGKSWYENAPGGAVSYQDSRPSGRSRTGAGRNSRLWDKVTRTNPQVAAASHAAQRAGFGRRDAAQPRQPREHRVQGRLGRDDSAGHPADQDGALAVRAVHAALRGVLLGRQRVGGPDRARRLPVKQLLEAAHGLPRLQVQAPVERLGPASRQQLGLGQAHRGGRGRGNRLRRRLGDIAEACASGRGHEPGQDHRHNPHQAPPSVRRPHPAMRRALFSCRPPGHDTPADRPGSSWLGTARRAGGRPTGAVLPAQGPEHSPFSTRVGLTRRPSAPTIVGIMIGSGPPLS